MRVPRVPPGRTFRSSWKQGWGPDLSMGLGFLQKVTSVTERDRATPNMSQIGLGSLIGLLIHGRERCMNGNRREDFWCTCALFPFQRTVNTKVSCSASLVFSHYIDQNTGSHKYLEHLQSVNTYQPDNQEQKEIKAKNKITCSQFYGNRILEYQSSTAQHFTKDSS